MTSLSAFLACTLALALLLFVAGPASAKAKPKRSAKAAKAAKAAADNYGVINATVNAATDHEILGSSAFPNFTTGAVDNYYSWAHSHVDNSPFAEGTASPVDTGPIGQTAAAGNFSQPQYADARWPGSTDSGKATFGNQGGPYAVSTAAAYDAVANSTEASSASSGSSGSGNARGVAVPKGFDRRLRVALAAWKARWLVPLHLKTSKVRVPAGVTTPTLPVTTTTLPVTTTLPTVTVPTVTTPGNTKSGSGSKSSSSSSSSGNTGALFESSSVAVLDPASGALVTSGESSLGNVDIGGQIVIRGIDVSASITNDGKPTDKVAIDIGAATIGGVPVTIDQNGVQVQGQGQNLPYKQADDALNGALKQAGVQLFTVQPEVVKGDNQLTVTATGLHVKFAQPVDQSGVPAQYAEHILGEVFVDSLAAPAGPVPNLNLNLNLGSSGSASIPGTGSTSGGSSTGFGSTSGSSSSPSSTYSSSSQPTSGSTGGSTQTSPASFLSVVRSKPMWLLIAFLVWQALAIGTGASLWRWRMGEAP